MTCAGYNIVSESDIHPDQLIGRPHFCLQTIFSAQVLYQPCVFSTVTQITATNQRLFEIRYHQVENKDRYSISRRVRVTQNLCHTNLLLRKLEAPTQGILLGTIILYLYHI